MASPNVLLISADMIGAANLGCYGDAASVSPNLDSLAARGVRFDSAYCACPPCIPARVSMMSGQYARTHGKLAHMKMAVEPPPPLLAELMAAAGYRTGVVGKTHWWPPDSSLGFADRYLTIDTHLTPELGATDAWIASLEEAGLFRYRQESWQEDRGRLRPDELPFEHLKANWTGARTCRLLEEYADGEQPFLLVASFVEPHGPGKVPRDYLARFDSIELPPVIPPPEAGQDVPPLLLSATERWRVDEATIDAYRRGVYAAFALVDDNVGRILAALAELGLEENTIVLFVSDHGDLMYDHGCIEKTFLYEQAINVPLIVAGPGLPAGVNRQQLVSHVDLLPTLLSAAGIPWEHLPIDGRSLLPIVADPSSTWRDTVYCEVEQLVHVRDLAGSAQSKMVRRGPWKYIYSLVNGHEVAEELYHLEDDPDELHNRARDSTAVTISAELRAELLRWMVASEEHRLRPAAENHYPVPRIQRRYL